MTAHQIRGDARMLPLATGSVQCVVTSPPYFGLRSYGGQASVWGGDPNCPHTLEDGPALKPMTGGTGAASKKQVTNAGSQFGNAWASETSALEQGNKRKPSDDGIDGRNRATDKAVPQTIIRTTSTCSLCGTWRGELGSEPTPALFVAHLVGVMRECWRVLRDDGVAFVNMGSSYAGSGRGPTAPPGIRQKSDMLIPQRLAIALSDDGWIIRQVLIWAKNNPMPESVRDRWTTAHEYILMLVKQPRYFFDQAGIQEPNTEGSLARQSHGLEQPHHKLRMEDDAAVVPGVNRLHCGSLNINGLHTTGRNGRSVWNLNGESYPGQHFATFPREIPRRCILAASREGDVVLDPFSGSGTSCFVAASLGRVGIGVELSAEYTKQARYGRLAQHFLPLVPTQDEAEQARVVEGSRDLFSDLELPA